MEATVETGRGASGRLAAVGETRALDPWEC